MEETQVKVTSSYQINDGHLISKDVKSERINYSELIINDKEDRKTFDRTYYDEDKRVKNIKLCIKFDNYFANLASILNFAVEAEKAEDTNLGIILKKIEKDLAYLQENYTIVERDFEERYSAVNIF